MKRITISLPDQIAELVKLAAGGDGLVSAYIAKALAEHLERLSLDQLLAEWEAETPATAEAIAWAEAELDRVGLLGPEQREQRAAG